MCSLLLFRVNPEKQPTNQRVYNNEMMDFHTSLNLIISTQCWKKKKKTLEVNFGKTDV